MLFIIYFLSVTVAIASAQSPHRRLIQRDALPAAAATPQQHAVRQEAAATYYVPTDPAPTDVSDASEVLDVAAAVNRAAAASDDTTSTDTPTSTATSADTTTTTTITSDVASITTAPTSSCTVASICADFMTCGHRYGACYDKNFCDGNTSPYPVPTFTCNPADGLSCPRGFCPGAAN